MAGDQGKVTEEAAVTIQPEPESETAKPEAPAPEPEAAPAPEPETPDLVEANPEEFGEEDVEESSHPVPSINPWAEAEKRLGRLVRSVTVHFHSHPDGDYYTLHASAAEGPDTHLEHNLGRL